MAPTEEVGIEEICSKCKRLLLLQVSNEIVFPINGRHVPVGELVLIGTSTDNDISDCHVYANWNDIKPFQKVLAAGPNDRTIILLGPSVIQSIII